MLAVHQKPKKACRAPLSPYAREVLISRAHPYFFYRAEALDIEPEDLARVSETLQNRSETPDVGNVIQHTVQWFNKQAKRPAQSSLTRLLDAFTPDPSWELSEPSLISCDWVPPHADDICEGDVFASLVLSTGGSPYVISMLETGKNKFDRGSSVTSVAREVRAGDFFVFSPNRVHMAVPKLSTTGARLNLLQRWVRVGTKDWQRALLQHWPRAEQDELLYAEGR